MASESAGQEQNREEGHRNHFRLLQEEGLSWSGREPNTLFQNRGDGADGTATFDEVGDVAGLYLRLDSRGAAAADLDGDGDLDLMVYNRNNPTIKVYRNDTPVQGRVALVDLVGTQSEILASGAQATLRCDGVEQLRQVELGSGFLSQAPPTLHFGLGACARIEGDPSPLAIGPGRFLGRPAGESSLRVDGGIAGSGGVVLEAPQLQPQRAWSSSGGALSSATEPALGTCRR